MALATTVDKFDLLSPPCIQEPQLYIQVYTMAAPEYTGVIIGLIYQRVFTAVYWSKCS